jgi:hypothetical protein
MSTDTSGCELSLQNLAFYLQGVFITPSTNITYEYFTTGSLPSSTPLRRVWQFQCQGTLSETSTLLLDYTEAHLKCPEYNISFEGALSGTFIVHNQVFSANKYISYQQISEYVLKLSLRIPKKILECYGVGTTQDYFFSVNLNDASASTGSMKFTYHLTEEDQKLLADNNTIILFKVYRDTMTLVGNQNISPLIPQYTYSSVDTSGGVQCFTLGESYNYPTGYVNQRISTGDADEYAFYYGAQQDYSKSQKIISLFGYNVNEVNYFNIIFDKQSVVQKSIICDSDSIIYTVQGEKIPNPFKSTHWTANCVSGHIPSECIQPSTTFLTSARPFDDSLLKTTVPSTDISGQKINVYFPSAEIAQLFTGETKDVSGCITGYLISVPDCEFQCIQKFPLGIMRIAIPHCYVSNGSYECTPTTRTENNKFDTYYWSVSSQSRDCMADATNACLPFWTVNARMLLQSNIDFEINGQKYAYIFWAPQDQVNAYLKGSKPYEAPIITWGSKKGFLLGAPTGAFYFRYKLENPEWAGSTFNLLPCYQKTVEMFENPITTQLTGKDGVNWCPQLYGDPPNTTTLESLLNNTVQYIGPVSNTSETSWPS